MITVCSMIGLTLIAMVITLVEIGVRRGLGSKIIMDNLKNNYFHIGVDPYGDRVYQHFDNDANSKWNGRTYATNLS